MANAGTYEGPAVLVTSSHEIAVEVALRVDQIRGLATWHGDVTADPTEDFWSVLQARQGRLRLPNGAEGMFIPARTVIGSGQLKITGSGTAPF
ncbi:DUF4873 domain-containing protein [Actinoplanes sp. NPDC051861]|uniref:DUF4873 domain-containing protein n=1 Tax=Actinoplanes sp. NPDC051861 TaxID=3155170 RepID=UPI003412D63E